MDRFKEERRDKIKEQKLDKDIKWMKTESSVKTKEKTEDRIIQNRAADIRVYMYFQMKARPLKSA